MHPLGAAGDIAYLASPQAGLLASSDGGATWEPRNTGVGQGFMGTILVDPADPQRIIAPDMANGLVTSSDGGRTWSVLGGPGGAMSAGWDPTDTGRLVTVGMSGAALSSDGGLSWTDLQTPQGTSAATCSTDGSALYAAALDGDTARLYTSTDDGRTWTTPWPQPFHGGFPPGPDQRQAALETLAARRVWVLAAVVLPEPSSPSRPPGDLWTTRNPPDNARASSPQPPSRPRRWRSATTAPPPVSGRSVSTELGKAQAVIEVQGKLSALLDTLATDSSMNECER